MAQEKENKLIGIAFVSTIVLFVAGSVILMNALV